MADYLISFYKTEEGPQYITKSYDTRGHDRYSKELKSYTDGKTRKLIGELEISFMIRRDDKYFNPDSPKPIKKREKRDKKADNALWEDGWGTSLTSYDNTFFNCCDDPEDKKYNDTVYQEYLARPDLIRNGQKNR